MSLFLFTTDNNGYFEIPTPLLIKFNKDLQPPVYFDPPFIRHLRVHIRNLKQVINHGLVLKKVHRTIKFNQKAWLKPYIDLNTELRKKAKNDFKNIFLS